MLTGDVTHEVYERLCESCRPVDTTSAHCIEDTRLPGLTLMTPNTSVRSPGSRTAISPGRKLVVVQGREFHGDVPLHTHGSASLTTRRHLPVDLTRPTELRRASCYRGDG
jgi:hypothetical protein